MNELWFAKVSTNRAGEMLLDCRALPVTKETPKRWYVAATEIDDRALIQYVSYIPKDENYAGPFGYRSFYGETELIALQLLVDFLEGKAEVLKAKSDKATKEHEKLSRHLQIKKLHTPS